MDYYNLTVFEFVTTQLGSQGTICAGGRYDYLMEQIGGKPAPAVGWAMGVERVLELLKEQKAALPITPIDAYAIVQHESLLPAVMVCLEELRREGVSVQMHSTGVEGMSSLKSQFKRADSSGAAFALVFGTDEIANGTVSVKSLRAADAEQRTEPLHQVSQWAQSLQSKA
jgi:histidyl-tRNA synthetase